MTILRVGTNAKYASGWETAFGKAKPARAGGTKGSKKKAVAKKAAKKRK
jgi:hypothetical protein